MIVLMDKKNLIDRKGILRAITTSLLFLIGICLLYNIYTLFFPISITLDRDGAEHMHTAYLLSIGERPYLDFLQNHPMLFHHFLIGMEKLFDITSTRELASIGRFTIFIHFILCVSILCLWATRVLKDRPRGIIWVGLLLTSFALFDLYSDKFHWIWHIRPDFICYGLTLLGLYFIFLWLERIDEINNRGSVILACIGGCLIGFGNAVLPKGIPFIAAFALTTISSILFAGWVPFIRKINFRNTLILSTIAFFTILSFIGGMILDCRLSKVPINIWIKAVFTLNSRKHILFTNNEVSPVTFILEAFSIPFAFSLMLFVWAIWELIQISGKRQRQNGVSAVWLFSVFTILINIILPSYSSGVSWSYYYIPSFFSATGIFLLLLLSLTRAFRQHSLISAFPFSRYIIIIFGTILFFLLINHPIQSIMIFKSRHSNLREVATLSNSDYIFNTLLPKDFVYLGHPVQIPTKSRHWGYYYMLSYDTGFWKDCFDLGLGPDPQKDWEQGFGDNPPDAIANTEPTDHARFIFMARECQGLDVSWILNEIEKNYLLMGGKGARFYIRNDKVAYMESIGWRILTSSIHDNT